jgi:tRNA threonylcarbamoyladenosine biosynthesis protein TsaB
MKASGFKFPDIDRVAVTIGPGSFTGLRVGISAARGIGLAASREVVGVTTLAALAAPLIDEDKSSPVVAAIDARHEHVYLQLFGKDVESTDVPRVALLRDAARAADIAPSRIVGSAATMIENLCSERPLAVCEKRAPDIEWVARLGAVPTNDAPAKPLYLRPPDALPQVAGLVPRR